MQLHAINYQNIPYYSRLVKDYLADAEHLKPFHHGHFSFESVEETISRRNQFPLIDRNKLVEVLLSQHEELEDKKLIINNINSLRNEKCYTITTGHQLNIFTGPVFFIYKIIHVINICERLNSLYPDYHFVPVYWMNTEDHDIEEINHTWLFGKKVQWETESLSGPTGSLRLQSLQWTIRQVEEILGDSVSAQEVSRIIRNAYSTNGTLSQATRSLVHQLFGKYGLIIMDQNHPTLKRESLDIFKTDLLKHSGHKEVTKTDFRLKKLGYQPQAHVRKINLFQLGEGRRSRIEKHDDQYHIVNRSESYSKKEILDWMEGHPEKISANVIVRPLFQQFVLPNLLYVGGSGELAYWLQLKSMFDAQGLFFPHLMLRNSALIASKKRIATFQKLGFQISDLFRGTDELIRSFVQKRSEDDPEIQEIMNEIDHRFDLLNEKVEKMDASLRSFSSSIQAKTKKSLQALQEKLLRVEKRKHDQSLNKIRKLKATLFPNNTLQERVENFSAFYSSQGNKFLLHLKEVLPPENQAFSVITY